MNFPASQQEQIELLLEYLTVKNKEIEITALDLHNCKNELHVLNFKISQLEENSDKGKSIKENIQQLKNTLTVCQESMTLIYKSLNQNPSRLIGFESALRMFMTNCIANYNIKIDIDFNFDDSMYKEKSREAATYLACSLSIEIICIHGFSNLLVSLSEQNGFLEFIIYGKELKSQDEPGTQAVTKLNTLKAVLIWAKAEVLPVTNWNNHIKFLLNLT